MAIMNNATINMGVSLQDPDFKSLGYIPGSNSVFNFLRNLHTVSIVAIPVSIPTNRVLLFSFLHILANACYLLGFLIIAILLQRRYVDGQQIYKKVFIITNHPGYAN